MNAKQRHIAITVLDQRNATNTKLAVLPLNEKTLRSLYEVEPDLQTGQLPDLIANENVAFIMVVIYVEPNTHTTRRIISGTTKQWREGDEMILLKAIAKKLGIEITRSLFQIEGGRK